MSDLAREETMDKPAKGFTRHKGHLNVRAALVEAAVARAGDMAMRRFVHQLYAHVSGRDLEGRTGEDLHAAAEALWAHGQSREPGKPKIAVVNPEKTRRTVVHIVNDDMPFLVDSVNAELSRQGFAVHLLIHPILRVRRDGAGKLIELCAATSPAEPRQGTAESWMRLEIDQCLDEARLKRLEQGLAAVLADVRAAVEDWRAMLARAKAVLGELSERPPKLPATRSTRPRISCAG
jgi:glutamate dehydrogenase